MRHQVYLKYKRSGIRWLRDVPEHWELKRLKFAAKRIMGQSPTSDEYTSDSEERPFLQGNAEFGERFPTPKHFCNVAAKYVPIGALMLSVRAPVGAINEADKDYGIGRGLCAVVPDGASLDNRFAWFAIHHTRIELATKATGSTYDAVSTDDVGNISLPLPSLDEQRAIADFLDLETTRLDTLVEKKRNLIEKLKEKRTALISRTVTKGLPAEAAAKAGLNPHPKLKASSIEWLGDIPEHWELLQLRRRITLQRGVDITKDEQNEGSIPVVSSGGISSHHDAALVRGPGVVVGRKGTAGAVYYIEEDFWPHDTTLYVREYRGSNPRYVYYKLLSMNLQNYDTGSANPTVNRNIVHPEIVSWPSPTEQRAIADYLDRETAKLDRMMEKVEAAIAKLQEYRTALITAAVTGKIDVRQTAT